MSQEKRSTQQLFNTDGSIFMGAKRNPENCNIGLYGVPYDGTTSFRPGARFGPCAIREVSNGIETFCPQLNLDLEEINFADFGSLDIPHGAPEPIVSIVNKSTQKLFDLGLSPLMLGGEHSITSGAVAATAKIYSDLILVQLDAHADLRQEWLGARHSHACAMRRCLEELPSKTLFQVGIRSGTRAEFVELQESNRLISHQTGQPANNLFNRLTPHLGKAIYLTIDLDWFDPSILPGTGTPEPGGFFWNDFAAIVDVLRKHNLVAADIVELAPQLDQSGISSILAAKVTRTLLMLLSESEKNYPKDSKTMILM